MTSIGRRFSLRLTVTGFALALVAGGALADKPSWAGAGKHEEGKEHQEERGHGEHGRDGDRDSGAIAFRFGSDDRRVASEYYGAQARKGKCPPGLAKKHDGCQPPGQAKKWQRGKPLAEDIRYNDLPKELRAKLPPPPPNHRYVQVAGDILMIAAGTSIVVDALEDILR